MKKCMKKNSNTFIIKVLLTIIYFILFTLCITFTMYALTWCLEDGESFFRVILFIGLLMADMILLIVLLSTWESCFKSGDEQ